MYTVTFLFLKCVAVGSSVPVHLHNLHKEVVDSVLLTATISVNHEAESFGRIKLRAEGADISVPSIVWAVTRPVFVEWLEVQGHFPSNIVLTHWIALLSGTVRSTGIGSTSIFYVELIVVAAVRYAHADITVRSYDARVETDSESNGDLAV